MRHLFIVAILFLVHGATVAQPFRTDEGGLLPKPLGWVSDYESIISDVDTRRLDSLCSVYDSIFSLEVAVITISESELEAADFDGYAFKLANGWGVGKKGLDNGITILVSRSLRKVRIEPGKGLTRILSERRIKTVIDSLMIPRFKAGDHAGGIEMGIVRLVNLLRSEDNGRLTPPRDGTVDPIRFRHAIESTSAKVLRLLSESKSDSVLNHLLHPFWRKTYQDDAELWSATIRDAQDLIREFGMPDVTKGTISRTVSGMQNDSGFPDPFGYRITFALAPDRFKAGMGVIELYFTGYETDRASILFVSDPKKGRR